MRRGRRGECIGLPPGAQRTLDTRVPVPSIAPMRTTLRAATRLALPLLLLSAALAAASDLVVRFVDVGQGDAALIKTPGGRAWLIDGGPRRKAATQAIRTALADLGVSALDGIVVSHPHLDHFGGLLRLIDDVPVGRVLYGIDIDAKTYAAFRAKLAAKGIPYVRAREGALAWDPALQVEVLHARGQATFDQLVFEQMGFFRVDAAKIHQVLTRAGCGVPSPLGMDLNDFSIVVRVGYGDTEILFTGDATEHVEARLLAGGKSLEAEILKVAHHGSKYSSTLEFLQEVDPEHAVIQCKAGNSYGHPHRPTLRRLLGHGSHIHRNDQSGDVTLTVGPDGTYRFD